MKDTVLSLEEFEKMDLYLEERENIITYEKKIQNKSNYKIEKLLVAKKDPEKEINKKNYIFLKNIENIKGSNLARKLF